MLRLQEIQSKLKVPKSQFNKFGNFNYRNCEDILEAVKPLLTECGLILLLSDSIMQIGERFYVQARASLMDAASRNLVAETTAYARETMTKKGMDEAQITGATSSYARKYALNGLFCIDDVKDPDHPQGNGKKPEDNSEKPPKKQDTKDKKPDFKATMNDLKKQIKEKDGKEDAFFQCLGAHGFEKVDQITEREDQEKVYKDLQAYLKVEK